MLDALPMRSFPAEEIQTIMVEAEAGIINIKQTDEQLIRFSGMAPISQKAIPVQLENDTTLLIQILPGSSIESIYVLEIPVNKKIIIQSNQSEINLSAYQGDISIDSTSGTITARNLTGKATLRSGRGNVTLQNSSGELHVLGEHGILTMKNLHGLLTSSTIMGTIQYSGSPTEGDRINLEVDHGPISIELGKTSNLEYSVQSASGEVNCLLPGVKLLSRGCSGTVGQGSAQLKIRSVSGKISLSVTH